MEDAQDFSWTSAMASHTVLLCQMEAGRVKWSDCHKIDRIRRANAQRVIGNSNGTAGSFRDKPLICKFFQTGTCSHNRDHVSAGHKYR